MKNSDSGANNNVTNRKDMTIDGYAAKSEQHSFSTTKDVITVPASFTDNLYAITHNGVTVVFTFRVKSAATPASAESNNKAYPAVDQTKILPEVTISLTL